MSPQPGTMRRLLGELPWILSVLVAVVAIQVAVPNLHHPRGSNWPAYFEAAEFFWDPTASYHGWRPPIHPYIHATLGQQIGFLAAGQLLARIGVSAIVLGAALTGRALGGPWVGALAALVVPFLQTAVEATTWMNMYPLSASAGSLGVAMGCVAARWPRVLPALLAGALTGLAWKINHLSLALIPTAGCLVALGAAARLPAVRRVALGLAFVLGVGGAVGLDRWIVHTYEVPQEDMSTQILTRRAEITRELKALGGSDPKFSACTDFVAKAPNLPELTNACARQFIAANWGTLRAEDCAPPAHYLWLLLPCLLIPAGWSGQRRWNRIRSSLGSTVAFAGPGAAMMIGAAWTTYSEKYMLSLVFLLAVLIPLASARLGGVVGAALKRRRRGRQVGLLIAALWLLFGWPRPQGWHADAITLPHDWEYVAGDVAAYAAENMGPSDLFLDCVPLRIDLVLLPQQISHKSGLITQSPCSDWIVDPPEAEGQVWLLSRAFDALPHTHDTTIAAHGWTQVRQYPEEHTLWVRKATE